MLHKAEDCLIYSFWAESYNKDIKERDPGRASEPAQNDR